MQMMKTNGLTAFLFASVAASAVVLTGCQKQRPHSDYRKARYGRHLGDYERVRELLYAFGEDKTRRLTTAEVAEMKRLRELENPVALEAAMLLGSSAYRGDEKLKADLVADIPRLANRPSLYANQSAFQYTKWFAAGKHRDLFTTIRTRLQAKPEKSPDETVFLMDLDQFLSEEKGK